MRKTVLYLLALGLIAGLLCVPVSAEEGWKFCIIERIVGLEHTTINGAPDNNSPSIMTTPWIWWLWRMTLIRLP